VHERETVEVRYQIRRLTRQIGRAQQMADEGLAPRNDLDDMSEELGYHQERQKVLADTWAAAEQLEKQQVAQQRAASRQLERNLAIARKNLASLDVVAPASGQLSGFTIEVGQSLSPGDRMVQIDDPDHYKVVADIDEFYLSQVAIARAVVSRPVLLLADEPTGNLVSQHGEAVMKLLLELNADGTTIVMVTHSSAHALYARRTIHLFDGKIVTERVRAAS
jgi:multidrug resistance efflux pump